MKHSFDVNVALDVGVEKAILIDNLAFWIKKNQANGKHAHLGYYWTYNSAEAFAELFPYWKADKIGRMLNQLEGDGVVLSDNFNELKMDRTKWYTICEKTIMNIYGLHSENIKNAILNISQPIPDSKPDSKPDKRNIKEKYTEEFLEFWSNYKKGNKKAAWAKWEKLSHKQKERVKVLYPAYVINTSKEPQYRKNAETYLNPEKEYWEDLIFVRRADVSCFR